MLLIKHWMKINNILRLGDYHPSLLLVIGIIKIKNYIISNTKFDCYYNASRNTLIVYIQHKLNYNKL